MYHAGRKSSLGLRESDEKIEEEKQKKGEDGTHSKRARREKSRSTTTTLPSDAYGWCRILASFVSCHL